MQINILSSGSHGNMAILDDAGNSLIGGRLIMDCGIKGKQLAMALEAPLSNIDGAFVTHGHGDHCKGAADLIKCAIPVYASYESLDEMGDEIRDSNDTAAVEAWEAMETENFTVMPFPAFHDAANPLNYLAKSKASGKKVVYIADTGYVNSLFAADVDAYMIECNYIDEILDYNARRNPQIKMLRERLRETHLSLAKVTEFFKRQFGQCGRLAREPKIILTHISEGNGDAKRMEREVAEAAGPFFRGVPEVIAARGGEAVDI